MDTAGGHNNDSMAHDPLVGLLAEVADAAREVALADQPSRLQNALAALALTESHVVTSFLEAESA